MKLSLIKFIRFYVTFDGDATIKPSESWNHVKNRKGTKDNVMIFDVQPDARDEFDDIIKSLPNFVRSRHIIHWDKDASEWAKPPKGAPKGSKNAKKVEPRRQATIRINVDAYNKLLALGGGNLSKGIEISANK